jgi:nucleotide-binding universal stress UspA family protein
VTGPIICGVDDSASAKGAARVARLLGTELGLSLVFVHVADVQAPEAEASAVALGLERLSADAS